MKNIRNIDLITIIIFVVLLIGLAIYGAWADKYKEEQPKTYTKTITREFSPGDTLTSNESGAWILWDSTMIKELQVAYITDSGTIEILK